jgi:hypothetical protein
MSDSVSRGPTPAPGKPTCLSRHPSPARKSYQGGAAVARARRPSRPDCSPGARAPRKGSGALSRTKPPAAGRPADFWPDWTDRDTIALGPGGDGDPYFGGRGAS